MFAEPSQYAERAGQAQNALREALDDAVEQDWWPHHLERDSVVWAIPEAQPRRSAVVSDDFGMSLEDGQGAQGLRRSAMAGRVLGDGRLEILQCFAGDVEEAVMAASIVGDDPSEVDPVVLL